MTGYLWWIQPSYRKSGRQRNLTKPAGFINSEGYLEIRFYGCYVKVHRAIWAIVKGQWPKHQIDHANLNRTDNRWCNLRAATHGQNRQNLLAYKNNTSGLKGVSFHKSERKWRAQIQVEKQKIIIGRFNTRKEAHAAYATAAKKWFGEFARS